MENAKTRVLVATVYGCLQVSDRLKINASITLTLLNSLMVS
jgi:hypothetical protein